jgi:hypothetical protein
MQKLSALAGIVSILVFFTLCKRSTDVTTLSVKELDVMEYVLRLTYGDGRYPTGYLDFLTRTPMPNPPSEWKWKDFPDEFHKRISDLPVRFRKASEAYLDGGHAFARRAPTSTAICIGLTSRGGSQTKRWRLRQVAGRANSTEEAGVTSWRRSLASGLTRSDSSFG